MYVLTAPAGINQLYTRNGDQYTVSAAGTITVPLADLPDALAAGFTLGSAGSIVPVNTVAASGASQAIAFPPSGNSAFDITLSANCVISLSGGQSGQYQTLTLILRQNSTAGWLPTLPSGIRWPGGVAPTPNTSAGNIDLFTLSTPDGGVTILGNY